MAIKCTYLYKVSMGNGDEVKEVVFCYARNKEAAKEGYKEIFKAKKYDKFDVVMFGEADIVRYPERFRVMPKDEVDYVIRTGLAQEAMYAQRKAKKDFFPERESK